LIQNFSIYSLETIRGNHFKFKKSNSWQKKKKKKEKEKKIIAIISNS